MKNQVMQRFHDVSTYVKLNSKRTYGECAIVMISTVFLVMSSVSTDSMNNESKVEVDATVATAKTQAATESHVVTEIAQGGEERARKQTERRFLSQKAIVENAVAAAKEKALTAEPTKEDYTEEEISVEDAASEDVVIVEVAQVADSLVTDVTAMDADATEIPELENEITDVALADAATENVMDTVPTAEPVLTENITEVNVAMTETAPTEITATDVVAVEEASLVDGSIEVLPEVSVVEETPVAAGIEPQENFGLSASDYDALCRIVQAEAGGEGEQGKMMVASVVINRVVNPSFPASIEGVITQDDQFSPVRNGSYQTSVPDVETLNAVNRVLSGENAAIGALYFKSVNSSADWNNRTLLYSYGNHNFYF